MYCIEDRYYNDINEIIDDIIDWEGKELVELPDDYTIEVGLCTLEPIFQLNSEKLQEILLDVYQERSSEEGEEWDKLEWILQKHINFEELNRDIPKLWFPTGKTETFTKDELIALQ